jgi:hypothetical protein
MRTNGTHARHAGADNLGLPLEPAGLSPERDTRIELAGWIVGVCAADGYHHSPAGVCGRVCGVPALAGRLP